jgi:hypothetical protein
MASIDKLALTCRLLYDQRVLDQRKEIEMLKMKYFFRDYTQDVVNGARKVLNFGNVGCMCSGCKKAGRTAIGEEDREAVCTFVPWFDKVLHERGLVVLRVAEKDQEDTAGPYADEVNKMRGTFIDQFLFSGKDCHLLEIYVEDEDIGDDPDLRWGGIAIGKKLWNAESINNQGIRQFERLFCFDCNSKISSPPTPPLSPRVAPPPSPRPAPPRPTPPSAAL